MIVPVDAERDEQGDWAHPALIGSGCETAADFHYWLRTQGLQCFVMAMHDEAPELFAVRSRSAGRQMMMADSWELSMILATGQPVTGCVISERADAFALLSCPTPETGKSKFSPLPAFS
ncbi:hypothetical protein [Escherichia coli]|uniref:hypothetical protein n=1 Tax=Escherichia coli TaxID=562 RepID=UPI000AC83E37|nr:hypothetical protein [Escherichia coli]